MKAGLILGIIVTLVIIIALVVFGLSLEHITIFMAIFLPFIFFGGLIIRIIMNLKSGKKDGKDKED